MDCDDAQIAGIVARGLQQMQGYRPSSSRDDSFALPMPRALDFNVLREDMTQRRWSAAPKPDGLLCLVLNHEQRVHRLNLARHRRNWRITGRDVIAYNSDVQPLVDEALSSLDGAPCYTLLVAEYVEHGCCLGQLSPSAAAAADDGKARGVPTRPVLWAHDVLVSRGRVMSHATHAERLQELMRLFSTCYDGLLATGGGGGGAAPLPRCRLGARAWTELTRTWQTQTVMLLPKPFCDMRALGSLVRDRVVSAQPEQPEQQQQHGRLTKWSTNSAMALLLQVPRNPTGAPPAAAVAAAAAPSIVTEQLRLQLEQPVQVAGATLEAISDAMNDLTKLFGDAPSAQAAPPVAATAMTVAVPSQQPLYDEWVLLVPIDGLVHAAADAPFWPPPLSSQQPPQPWSLYKWRPLHTIDWSIFRMESRLNALLPGAIEYQFPLALSAAPGEKARELVLLRDRHIDRGQDLLLMIAELKASRPVVVECYKRESNWHVRKVRTDKPGDCCNDIAVGWAHLSLESDDLSIDKLIEGAARC